jgi:Holliday junction DNA helicase RuvB
MSEDDARKVAVALIGKSHDVRDAIRIARLARRVGTDKAVELLVET